MIRSYLRMSGLQAYTNDNGEFTLNNVIPMPKQLEMAHGSETFQAMRMFLSNKKYYDWDMDVAKDGYRRLALQEEMTVSEPDIARNALVTYNECYLPLPNEYDSDKLFKNGRQYCLNVMLFGYPTWSDWRMTNWGTPWDISSNEWSDDDNEVGFDTIHAAPVPVAEELSRQNPGTPVLMDWTADGVKHNVIFKDGAAWLHTRNGKNASLYDFA